MKGQTTEKSYVSLFCLVSFFETFGFLGVLDYEEAEKQKIKLRTIIVFSFMFVGFSVFFRHVGF